MKSLFSSPDPIRIGILSDTHKRGDLQEEAIAHLKKEGAQYLLHLGDLELLANLEALANSGLPYASVFGNNDYALKGMENSFRIKKEPYYLKIKDTTIKMMHLPYYLSADTDIVLYGHTHKFNCEYKNGTLFLNPGEICARNKNLSECAMIEVKEKKFFVKYYFRELDKNNYNSEKFVYNFK